MHRVHGGHGKPFLIEWIENVEMFPATAVVKESVKMYILPVNRGLDLSHNNLYMGVRDVDIVRRRVKPEEIR